MGINHSNGVYIAFIDADDLWYADKLFKQIEFMKKNNFEITHTSYEIINENNIKVGERKAKLMNYKRLVKSCDIGLSSVILKKNLITQNIKFPNLKTKEDFIFWLKISQKGKVIYALKKTLVKWRRNQNSLSSSTIRKLIDGYYVYRHYLRFGIIKSLHSLFTLSINYLKKY